MIAIENDFAMVDVGLKTEGRVPLREFAMPGVPTNVQVGDEVEVYLERVENALGDAVLSRPTRPAARKAGSSWSALSTNRPASPA